MTTRAFQHALMRPDYYDGVAYWKDREFKKYAVHVVVGPDRRPTSERISFALARTPAAAAEAVKRNTLKPGRARFLARLAGPHELGCVRMPDLPRRPA